MQIFVKTVDGKTITVRISLAARVLVLRKMLEEETGKSMDGIRISYASKDLNDMRTLESYGVEKGSNINLLAKLRGGMDWRGFGGPGTRGGGSSSDSDDSGRSWATSELPSPTSDGDDEKWVAKMVRRKKEVRASGRQHRRHHKDRDTARSSTDIAPATLATSAPLFEPSEMTNKVLQLALEHELASVPAQVSRGIEETVAKAKDKFEQGAQAVLARLNAVPIMAAVNQHKQECDEQIAQASHDIGVLDDLSFERHNQTMGIATSVFQKLEVQGKKIAALEKQVKSMKSAPKKVVKKTAPKKVMKKAMKAKAMKAMKK